MPEIRITPALKDILRVLSTQEALSNKDILSRSGRELKRDKRDKLAEAGLIIQGRGPITVTLTEQGARLRADIDDDAPAGKPAAESVADRLSAKERIALIALLSPSLRVSYAEVRRIFGLTISVTIRTSLEDKKLVAVPSGRSVSFELTEKGWQAAETELSRPGEPGDPPILRLLHHHYAQILGALRVRGLGLIDMYTENHVDTGAYEPLIAKTVGARVIEAYNDLAYEPEGWVSLTRLRSHLHDVNRLELDEVLTALFRDGRINLIAEANQKTLTDRDRASALHVVGDDKHLYSVG